MARNTLYPASVKPGIPKLGIKPKGWIETTFGDVLQVIQRPAEIEDNVEYQLVTAKRARGGIVPREVLTGKKILTKVQYYVEKDDFLISKRQIVHGACGIVPADLNGALVSGEYSVLRVKDSLLLRYLDYLSHTDYFQMTCFQASVGVDIEKMIFDLKEWLNFKIYLPDKNEQQDIVNILKTWDNAVLLNERLVNAKQQLKTGLMQDLLSGRRRFSQYQYSWKTKKLGELATVKRGASPRPITDPIYFADQGRGWVRISDVTSSPTRFLNRTTQYLSAIGETRSLRVEVGDIIMSICATIGVPKIINIPACIHDGFVLFSDYQEHLDQEFLYHYINFIATKLANQGQPGTQRNLNSEIVRRIDIPHISLDEQREIADVLNAVDHEIDLLIQRLYAIKMEKKGLMQKLLTGQLRIKI